MSLPDKKFKLSPSELTYLFDGCKFCFWLKIRHGISQPSMPMPGIFSAIAAKQKGFYDNKRTEEFCPELPPGVVAYGEKWVQSKVIQFPGIEASCHIKGRFDLVIRFDDGSYGVLDCKTASPSEEKGEMYGRQLQAYAYALENPESGALHLTPISKLGLLFFDPTSFDQHSATRQSFSGNLVWMEVKPDNRKFMTFLGEVIRVIESDSPPPAAADCVWCKYKNTMIKLNIDGGQSVLASSAEMCPVCNSPMKLRNGKYGEFFSCIQYPACKGTKRKV